MSERRIVTIHQPNFLPWLGFFHKMLQADVFILLDNVPFSKNSYQNRVEIKSAHGPQWLTVPVLTKGRSGQLTCDVAVNPTERWRRTHLGALRSNYQPAPFYDDVMAWLRPLYKRKPTKLTPFNYALIEVVREQLGLSTELIPASSLDVDGSASELLLDLVLATGGDVYLSGPSGHDYLDTALFNDAGVDVHFQDFDHPTYPQLHGEFISELSILDLLMNVGPTEARRRLQNSTPTLENAEASSQYVSAAGAEI